MKKVKYLLATALMVSFVGSSAMAETASYSGQTLEKRLERLEKDLRILNKEVYRNGAGVTRVTPMQSSSSSSQYGKKQMADFSVRLSTMERKLNQLNGEIETIKHQQGITNKTLEKIQKDVEFRFNNMNTKDITSEASVTTTSSRRKMDLSVFNNEPKAEKILDIEKLASATPVISSSYRMTPEQEYGKAFELLKNKNYKNAEKAFSNFILKYPTHNLAGNAQYWLAETFYVRGETQEAMRNFAIGYKKYKNSSKATDNLLKLGITLGILGRKEDACLTLNELETKYTPLPKNIANRSKYEKKKLGCK